MAPEPAHPEKEMSNFLPSPVRKSKSAGLAGHRRSSSNIGKDTIQQEQRLYPSADNLSFDDAFVVDTVAGRPPSRLESSDAVVLLLSPEAHLEPSKATAVEASPSRTRRVMRSSGKEVVLSPVPRSKNRLPPLPKSPLPIHNNRNNTDKMTTSPNNSRDSNAFPSFDLDCFGKSNGTLPTQETAPLTDLEDFPPPDFDQQLPLSSRISANPDRYHNNSSRDNRSRSDNRHRSSSRTHARSSSRRGGTEGSRSDDRHRSRSRASSSNNGGHRSRSTGGKDDDDRRRRHHSRSRQRPSHKDYSRSFNEGSANRDRDRRRRSDAGRSRSGRPSYSSSNIDYHIRDRSRDRRDRNRDRSRDRHRDRRDQDGERHRDRSRDRNRDRSREQGGDRNRDQSWDTDDFSRDTRTTQSSGGGSEKDAMSRSDHRPRERLRRVEGDGLRRSEHGRPSHRRRSSEERVDDPFYNQDGSRSRSRSVEKSPTRGDRSDRSRRDRPRRQPRREPRGDKYHKSFSGGYGERRDGERRKRRSDSSYFDKQARSDQSHDDKDQKRDREDQYGRGKDRYSKSYGALSMPRGSPTSDNRASSRPTNSRDAGPALLPSSIHAEDLDFEIKENEPLCQKGLSGHGDKYNEADVDIKECIRRSTHSQNSWIGDSSHSSGSSLGSFATDDDFMPQELVDMLETSEPGIQSGSKSALSSATELSLSQTLEPTEESNNQEAAAFQSKSQPQTTSFSTDKVDGVLETNDTENHAKQLPAVNSEPINGLQDVTKKGESKKAVSGVAARIAAMESMSKQNGSVSKVEPSISGEQQLWKSVNNAVAETKKPQSTECPVAKAENPSTTGLLQEQTKLTPVGTVAQANIQSKEAVAPEEKLQTSGTSPLKEKEPKPHECVLPQEESRPEEFGVTEEKDRQVSTLPVVRQQLAPHEDVALEQERLVPHASVALQEKSQLEEVPVTGDTVCVLSSQNGAHRVVAPKENAQSQEATAVTEEKDVVTAPAKQEKLDNNVVTEVTMQNAENIGPRQVPQLEESEVSMNPVDQGGVAKKAVVQQNEFVSPLDDDPKVEQAQTAELSSGLEDSTDEDDLKDELVQQKKAKKSAKSFDKKKKADDKKAKKQQSKDKASKKTKKKAMSEKTIALQNALHRNLVVAEMEDDYIRMQEQQKHEAEITRKRTELAHIDNRLVEIEEEKQSDLKRMKSSYETKRVWLRHDLEEKFLPEKKKDLSVDPKMRRQKAANEVEVESAKSENRELEKCVEEATESVKALTKENEILETQMGEYSKNFDTLKDFIVKKTAEEKKLRATRKKILGIMQGTREIMNAPAVKQLYRDCMYRIRTGVNLCEQFDFALSEEIEGAIKECEEEVGCPVLTQMEAEDMRKERDAERQQVMKAIEQEGTEGSTESAAEIQMAAETESQADAVGQLLLEVMDKNQIAILVEHKDMLLSIFTFLDKDGDGSIDPEEFEVGIDLLNKRLPETGMFHDHTKLFKALDADGSGYIVLNEFQEILNVNFPFLQQ